MVYFGDSMSMTGLQKSYLNGKKAPCGMTVKALVLYEFSGKDFNKGKFSYAVEQLPKYHPVLNYRRNGDGKFISNTDSSLKAEFVSCSVMEDLNETIENIYREAYENVIEESFVRFITIETNDGRIFVAILTNGLMFDGQSHDILIGDIEMLYAGKEPMYENGFSAYSNFLHSENKVYDAEDLDYWTNKASLMLGNPELPLQKEPETILDADTFSVYRKISFDTYEKLARIAADHSVTKFAVLLTLFGKTLSLYSKNNRFYINLPVSDRKAIIPEMTDNSLGLFANAMVMDFYDSGSIRETLQSVQEQLMELCDYADIPVADVLKIMQKVSGRPVQVSVSFTEISESVKKLYLFNRKKTRVQTSQLWIETLLVKCDSYVELSMTCIKQLISRELAEQLADTFYEVVERLAANENTILDNVVPKPRAADISIINKLNDTFQKDPFVCLSDRIKMSFENHGTSPAIFAGGNVYSYSQLQDMAGSLLYYLKNDMGLISGRSRIGILLKKGPGQIVCSVAAICGGIAYMPLEAELPPESMHECCFNASIEYIITESSLEAKAGAANIPFINIDKLDLAHLTYKEPFVKSLPRDVSIIINTSGTTGTPKSVCIYQDGIVNCLINTIRIFKLDDTDRILALTNFCHDMAIFDSLGILLCGGAVVIPDDNIQKDPVHWDKLISDFRVTIWNSVPAFMEMMVSSNKCSEVSSNRLKHIFLGGDWISTTLAEKVKSIFPQAENVSVGGPTETTVWNIYHIVNSQDIANGFIPYGRPFPNTKYYILNEKLGLCPLGIEGTMYVSGVGVTAGYAGLQDETKRKYITWNGKRVYNTGDLGMYLPDGTIKIIGRSDFQVKINGKRIELSGIEKVLNQFNGIINSVVVVNQYTGKLAAYYVSNIENDNTVLRKYLERNIPVYMVPSTVTGLDEFPLTRNGKIDRKKLSNLRIDEKVTIVEEKYDAVVVALIQICKSVLKDSIRSEDLNFYVMGGDSISSMMVIEKIKEKFGVEMSITDLLMFQTLPEWAEIIKERMANNCDSRDAVDQLCKKFLGVSFHESVCLYDYDEIYMASLEISAALSKNAGKDITVYKVLSCPFAEDWIRFIEEID